MSIRIHDGARCQQRPWYSSRHWLITVTVQLTVTLVVRKSVDDTHGTAYSLCDSGVECNDARTKLCRYRDKKCQLLKVLLVLTRDLFALSEQQNVSISTDIERRAGLSAIAEHLVKQPVVVI